MKIGARVRITGIPPNLPDDERFKTPEVFKKCLGRVFAVCDIQNIEGLNHPIIGLDIGEAVGKPAYMETIYVEPEYLEEVTD